jgi:precorrin isomerase
VKKKNKNCIVIGSSFTALVCILDLIKNGYSPIVIDVGANYLAKDTYN